MEQQILKDVNKKEYYGHARIIPLMKVVELNKGEVYIKAPLLLLRRVKAGFLYRTVKYNIIILSIKVNKIRFFDSRIQCW